MSMTFPFSRKIREQCLAYYHDITEFAHRGRNLPTEPSSARKRRADLSRYAMARRIKRQGCFLLTEWTPDCFTKLTVPKASSWNSASKFLMSRKLWNLGQDIVRSRLELGTLLAMSYLRKLVPTICRPQGQQNEGRRVRKVSGVRKRLKLV